MRVCWKFVLLLILITLSVAGCKKADEPPTPTPDQSSIQAASTLFAQPTRAPHATPTATPIGSIELELNRVIAQMEQAVLAGDSEKYMTYISEADPVFWTEQSRWAKDWQDHQLRAFNLSLSGINTISDTEATARLTMIWSQRDSTDAGSAGGTTVSVVFRHEGGLWRLGGELWQTFDVEGIRFYYFANDILNNRAQADAVKEYLPGIYTRVTREFDFVPEQTAHIKMYESIPTMQNMTRLSMSRISLWNEPGEAIKITLGPSNTPPQEVDVAREFTRFVLYEMAGGTHGNFPWWLEEGIAEYGSSLFRTLSQRNRVLKQIAGLAEPNDEGEMRLVDWEALQTAPDPSQLEIARNQAYTLVQYVTQTYGTEKRNAWIKAIATEQTLEEATEAHLGVSFEDLNAVWQGWLPSQG